MDILINTKGFYVVISYTLATLVNHFNCLFAFLLAADPSKRPCEKAIIFRIYMDFPCPEMIFNFYLEKPTISDSFCFYTQVKIEYQKCNGNYCILYK